MNYIGRFAPSPTGPLHLGSLYTALASYLDAKANKGKWLVRIEDIDPPREIKGASKAQLKSLLAHGLQWDEEVLYQSLQSVRYNNIINALLEKNQAFACQCSRQQLKDFNGFYPGYCHKESFTQTNNKAIRLYSAALNIHFNDDILGLMHADTLPTDLHRDFVIKRRDELFAYQLAVVADDIHQGITHIMRGADILDSTFKQLTLYKALEHTPPSYSHLPVINADNGQKLSKQNLAPAIDDKQNCANLLSCLKLLQQPLPTNSHTLNQGQILQQAIQHWDKTKIPTCLAINP